MFTKIIILSAASASFLYTTMYAIVSSYYRNGNHTTGSSQESL